MLNAVAYSQDSRPEVVVDELARGFAAAFDGVAPKAIVLFAGPSLAHEAVLAQFRQRMPTSIVVGSTSSGEFADERFGQGSTSALAIGGDDVVVSAALGRGVAEDVGAVARQLASGFRAEDDSRHPHRSALVFADALGGQMEELVRALTVATGSEYKFFGGGAGDNAAFAKTSVFCGETVASDAAVALELRSSKPIGLGACHGWMTGTPPLRVTEADGMRLISLDGLPAVVAFEDYAEETGQSFDRDAPIAFFLHNVLGIISGDQTRLRVPLKVDEDGAVWCAAEIPTGALVSIMRSSADNAVEAARAATASALADLGEARASGALVFDCVATRLRLADQAAGEIDAVRSALPGVPLAGCHTHGQVVRNFGQFSGFQNCTAVVCLLPE